LLSIAAPDQDWWTDNINSEFISSEVHQECRISLASVSLEPPSAIESDSTSEGFQAASQPSGFSQQSFDFNMPADFDIDFEQKASQAYSDSASCMVAQNSVSPIQSDWNSTQSSSTLPFDCDFYGNISSVSTPPGDETLSQESQERRQSQISVFDPFNYPHCFKPFPSEQRLKYVALLSCALFLLRSAGITFKNPTSVSAIQTYVMTVEGALLCQKI
jgi:hypothetical protein